MWDRHLVFSDQTGGYTLLVEGPADKEPTVKELEDKIAELKKQLRELEAKLAALKAKPINR